MIVGCHVGVDGRDRLGKHGVPEHPEAADPRRRRHGSGWKRVLGAWGQRERKHPLACAIPQFYDLRVRVGQSGELPARRLPGVLSRMLDIGPHGGMGGHAVELAEAL